MLGAFGKLILTFAGFRLRAIAGRGLLPVVDLLLQRRFGGGIADSTEVQFGPIRRRLHHGAANALGLEERPQVGSFDILGDSFSLRAFAERFRQREKQRDHRDQQCDFPVFAGRMFGVFGVLHAFMRAHDSSPPLEYGDDGRTIWQAQGSGRVRRRQRCPKLTDFRRAGARSDTLPEAARYRSRYKSGWSTAKRGRAVPGSHADRRRATTGGWRRNDAARAALRCPANRVRRAIAPW